MDKKSYCSFSTLCLTDQEPTLTFYCRVPLQTHFYVMVAQIYLIIIFMYIHTHIYIYLWFGSVRLTPRTENHKLQEEESEGCLGSDLEAACNAHLPQIQALPQRAFGFSQMLESVTLGKDVAKRHGTELAQDTCQYMQTRAQARAYKQVSA